MVAEMSWFTDKQIVLPIDYSRGSAEVAEFVASVADEAQSIHALHVVPDLNTPYGGYIEGLLDDGLIDNAKEHLHKWLHEHPAIQASAQIRIGDPGYAIANFLRETAADAVVLASHGRTGLTRFMLGSVAERVLRHAPCDALIMKKARDHETIEPIHAPVIVPYDFDEDGKRALRAALEFAHGTREVHILHVIQEISATDPTAVWGTVDDEKRKQHARGRMEEELRDLLSPATILDVGIGDPGHVITDLVAEINAGLVVICSHGRNWISRVLLGSVTERVARYAACSVLVLKHSKVKQDAEPSPALAQEPKKTDEDAPVEVCWTHDISYATLLKNALEGEGIEAEVMGPQQGGFAGLSSIPISVVVRSKDYDAARRFVARIA